MVFHILLTTDLSDESTSAFERTAALARRMEARITLLHAMPEAHVIGIGFQDASGPTAEERGGYLERARDRLQELRQMLPEDLQVTTLADTGDSVESIILRWAEGHEVDLIAMATHGRSGWKRVVMGSVAEAVLRSTDIPVLLFPVKRH